METKSKSVGLNTRIRIGVLTSSRADFGIYFPLLKKLKNHSSFILEIIAFGTHLDKQYGYTINEILDCDLEVKHRISTLTQNKSPYETSVAIGDTILKFSEFWDKNKFDLVLCLGDRYEMFAAVTASLSFGVQIAHIHAGETTLGAVDNVFRHSISLISSFLFVTTDKYEARALEIKDDSRKVFLVGALSIENLENLKYYTIQEFFEEFRIDLNRPTILTTFHPETISLAKNEQYAEQLIESLDELRETYQIIITMPNSDTLGDMIRKKVISFAKGLEEVKLVESFGMRGYLSCMKHCSILLGNTSSGFVEASYFPKKVINLGNRQSGRIVSKNIFNCPVEKDSIIKAVRRFEKFPLEKIGNIYKRGNAADNIIEIILKLKLKS